MSVGGVGSGSNLWGNWSQTLNSGTRSDTQTRDDDKQDVPVAAVPGSGIAGLMSLFQTPAPTGTEATNDKKVGSGHDWLANVNVPTLKWQQDSDD